MSESQVMPTVGAIARRLGEPIHKIEYILKTRNIQPSGMAGNARVYTDDDVDRIAEELRRIGERRSGQ